MNKYLECHELLAVDVINDILESDDELKKYIYTSFQNMLNKHYDVMMDMVNGFKLKNCFTKKNMSQDLDKITFSSVFKNCVDKFYRVLKRADCETLRLFGKLMDTIPHEKKSAFFLTKLRKTLKQKGGKVIINGTTTTVVEDEVIQGMGIKGAISSFLKNIINYKDPGQFDDSTKNLFRMLHTLYSNNMNIFVIVMSKIMKKLYGTDFKYANERNEKFKPTKSDNLKSSEKIISRVTSHNSVPIADSVTALELRGEEAKEGASGEKGVESGKTRGGYYNKLDKILKEKKRVNFQKENAEKLITEGEIRILELIMKEVEKTNMNDEMIKKFEDQRFKANIALSKPQSRVVQSGGGMYEMDNRNFNIIYENYSPIAESIVNKLDDFVTKLNKNQGFQSLKKSFDFGSLDEIIGAMGSMISTGLEAPTIYMNMASDVMSVFNDNLSSVIQDTPDEKEERDKKTITKFNFYKSNITEFVAVLTSILEELHIPEGADYEIYRSKQSEIKSTSGYSARTNVSSTNSPSNSPNVESDTSPPPPTQKIEEAPPKTLSTFFNQKRAEFESKIYDKLTKERKEEPEKKLYDIINRQEGYLPPEEKKIKILFDLFDLSSQLKKTIDELAGSQDGTQDGTRDINIVLGMPKISESMEYLKNYLIANRASIMDTTWDDDLEIGVAKAKLATNKEGRSNVKLQAKQTARDLKDSFNKISADTSEKYGNFMSQYNQKGDKRRTETAGGGSDIGKILAVALFKTMKKLSDKNIPRKVILETFEKIEPISIDEPNTLSPISPTINTPTTPIVSITPITTSTSSVSSAPITPITPITTSSPSSPIATSSPSAPSSPITTTDYNGALVLLIHNEDVILLHDTAFSSNPNYGWSIPGGKRKPGDSIALTAQKELFEETKGLLYIDEKYFRKAENAGMYSDFEVSCGSDGMKMRRCYFIDIVSDFDIKLYSFKKFSDGDFNETIGICKIPLSEFTKNSVSGFKVNGGALENITLNISDITNRSMTAIRKYSDGFKIKAKRFTDETIPHPPDIVVVYVGSPEKPVLPVATAPVTPAPVTPAPVTPAPTILNGTTKPIEYKITMCVGTSLDSGNIKVNNKLVDRERTNVKIVESRESVVSILNSKTGTTGVVLFIYGYPGDDGTKGSQKVINMWDKKSSENFKRDISFTNKGEVDKMCDIYNKYDKAWFIGNQSLFQSSPMMNVKTNLVFTIIPFTSDNCSTETTEEQTVCIKMDSNDEKFKDYSSLFASLVALDRNNCEKVVIPCSTEENIKYTNKSLGRIFVYKFDNIKEVILTF